MPLTLHTDLSKIIFQNTTITDSALLSYIRSVLYSLSVLCLRQTQNGELHSDAQELFKKICSCSIVRSATNVDFTDPLVKGRQPNRE
jgi:hypothetical protein